MTDPRGEKRAAHPAPPNKWGFFMYHTQSGYPMTDKQIHALFDIIGPIHENIVMPKIRADIAARKEAERIKTISADATN